MKLSDYAGIPATMPGLTSPIVIGQLEGKITFDDMKYLLGIMDSKFNLLSDILPLPSLKESYLISDLSWKGLTDVCLEILSAKNLKPDIAQWDSLDSQVEFYCYWRIAEWVALRGYLKKPLATIQESNRVNGNPHLLHIKVNYSCPFGCINSMMINANASNHVRGELYILWMLDHLRNFHKHEFKILDNLLVATIPDSTFLPIATNKGESVSLPKLKYLNDSSCPKCGGKENVFLTPDLVLCNKESCNHSGGIKEFKP